MTYGDSPYAEKFRAAGIRVIDFHPEKKFSPSYVRFIRRELKAGGYHILMLFNNKAMVNGILAAMSIPVKVVVYRGYTGNIHWSDPFMYLKYLSPRVDRIICLVEAIRQLFRKNLLFRKDKAVTIHKGHDIAWYEGVEPVGKKALGIPENAFVIICGANVRRMKGVRYLLKATYHLPADSNIHLAFAGNGMDVPLFKKLIENSPFRQNIHVLGFRKDILNVVKTADVFVLPSIKGEAITKSVIEAMSLGICPLITDIPGNQGLVIDHQCGLVVPPRNPEALAKGILWLYENRERCREFGTAAREHIRQNFDIRNTVIQYDALYRELYGELTGDMVPDPIKT